MLEIQSMDFRAGDSGAGTVVEVSGVGFHGLLPKLDFFMLAEHFFRIDGRSQIRLPWRMTPLLSAVQAGLSQLDTGKYGDKLLGMLSFLGMQVGGNPDGAHAAFKDYAVDAVTARVGVRTHTHIHASLLPERVYVLAVFVHLQVLRLGAMNRVVPCVTSFFFVSGTILMQV